MPVSSTRAFLQTFDRVLDLAQSAPTILQLEVSVARRPAQLLRHRSLPLGQINAKECPRLRWKGNSMRKTNVNEWLFLVRLLLAQTDRRIRSSLKRRWCVNAISASLLLAAFLFTATSAGATDTLTVIHKFVGGNGGNEPNWLIRASDGNFYGTTYLAVGTVFQVTPDGHF